MPASRQLQAALAAHRFGLGEASLDAVGGDAPGWLLAQIGPADAAVGDALADARSALQLIIAEQDARKSNAMPTGDIRELDQADTQSRLATAAATRRPFAERLGLFWANHFTVSIAEGPVRGLAGAFEREAIRPHIAGTFETLLYAAVTHPAMLRYLDNTTSAGPNSRRATRAARRDGDDAMRKVGLNENLARELLELHTLGAESARSGVYTQADVLALAAVLTGWRVEQRGADAGTRFDAAWHEAGPKTVLGRRYPEGADGLRRVLHDLAVHPATARFVTTRLARHLIADEPPPALIEQLTLAWMRHGGELAPVYRALVQADAAWQPEPAKLKTPEEFVLSTLRLLGPGDSLFARAETRGKAAGGAAAGAVAALGQRLLSAPSPAGWSDLAADWLGPDAVWKRVEWATRVGDRFGRRVDARALASASLGPLLGDASRAQIERAADGAQALALLLMTPEFQRR